jgi:hypothetical protein
MKLPGEVPEYKSDTSEEFVKYQTPINEKFSTWTQRKKE